MVLGNSYTDILKLKDRDKLAQMKCAEGKFLMLRCSRGRRKTTIGVNYLFNGHDAKFMLGYEMNNP